MLPNKKIIETSIMGIARQKYSDFAVNQESDATLAKKKEDIADKIDILRNSKQFTRGSEWMGAVGDQKNARLLQGIRKKQLVRESSQQKWESTFSVNNLRDSQMKSRVSNEDLHGNFKAALSKDRSIQKITMDTQQNEAMKAYLTKNHGFDSAQHAKSSEFLYDPKFVKQFKKRYSQNAQKVAEKPFHPSKSHFRANQMPVNQFSK